MLRARPSLAPVARVVLVVVIAAIVGSCSDSSPAASATAATAATAATSATSATSATTPTAAPETTATSASAEPDSTGAPRDSTAPDGTDPETDPEVAALIDARPVDVIVPAGLDEGPAPLVVVLHGYSGTADVQQGYFRFQDEAADRGFVLAYPDGTSDERGLQFWNATESCCNFFASDVDDVAYLAAVVDHVRSVHAIDPQRIFLAGHSNGGFMSYRLACERADLIAAVVSLAGATFVDPSECTPSEPVSIAQVHGTLDEVIAYDGGDLLGNDYPAARATVETWAAYNGCDAGTPPTDAPDRLDLDTGIADDDSTVTAFAGCPADGAAELWTIDTGRHIPSLSPAFATAVFDFFEAHPDID